jgi:Dyp-type peroxidase family
MTQLTDQELKDIQGIAVGRFRKDHQDLLFVRFGSNAASSRRLLAEIAPRIANAWEVRVFNNLFSEVRRRAHVDNIVRSTWTAVGLSATGFQKLGVNLQELATLPGADAFSAGMAARSASQIGDSPADGPSNWLDAFRPGAGVDALFVVASDAVADLDAYTDWLTNQIQACGAEIVYRERGGTLPAPLAGHEHFGFKDGVSQPAIAGVDAVPGAGQPSAVAAGEFILGYPNNEGTTASVGSLWLHGTFGVFRRLRQDVAAFRAQAQSMTSQTSPAQSADQVEADLVGRWPSGTPLALSPSADPGPSGVSNAFDYVSDPDGEATPRFGHIRKVNPRDEARPDQSTDPSQNHRMLRGGIPYGEPLSDGSPDDGADRGLHFLAFMGNIDQQFEFIQRQWASNPNFPNGGAPGTQGGPYTPPAPGTPPDGVDPVIGSHNSGDQVSLNQGGAIHSLSLMAETVNVTAGEYFFYPAISAVTALGSGATASTPPPTPAIPSAS